MKKLMLNFDLLEVELLSKQEKQALLGGYYCKDGEKWTGCECIRADIKYDPSGCE